MPTRLPAGLEESVNFQRRRARIQEMEHQQAMEDLADMKLTKSQLKTLNGTFSTVEVQYTDLDGLTWTDPRARLILEDWKNLNTVPAPAPIMAPLMTRENHTLCPLAYFQYRSSGDSRATIHHHRITPGYVQAFHYGIAAYKIDI
ncbi:hypothetical protein EW026_g7326 [Hermanssonia centrifuga]|uniref:Uncharacterized protein n=1 Tax=Hermanssonia centrifuga TaxID=98765 RepID=A0A4S4K873_9APHY|nr:hypothetical protein EW026_g7326 [Hermanssonia centrifuga]